MKRKGIEFRFASHLTYRSHNRDDFESDEAFERHKQYVVIVSRRTGKPVPRESWSRTNMMYGVARDRKDATYLTRPVYWVESGSVYQGTIRRTKPKTDAKHASQIRQWFTRYQGTIVNPVARQELATLVGDMG